MILIMNPNIHMYMHSFIDLFSSRSLLFEAIINTTSLKQSKPLKIKFHQYVLHTFYILIECRQNNKRKNIIHTNKDPQTLYKKSYKKNIEPKENRLD